MLRSELIQEKKRRERLEDLYYKRDDQVSQLKSTFDKSLNTISKDTKNIKSILGKSLKTLDREMTVTNNGGGDVQQSDYDDEMTSSELTFPESDYVANSTAKFSGSRYLNLPTSLRSKSVETPVNEIRHKYSASMKVTSPPSASPSSKSYGRSVKSSPLLVASNRPTTHHAHRRPLLTDHQDDQTPTRDLNGSRSKSSSSKRYSK